MNRLLAGRLLGWMGLLLATLSVSCAQSVQFKPVLDQEGASLGKVNGITQDPLGYLWFANQTKRCITRYDGYRMRHYRHNPLNPQSLGGTHPECILADSSGTIWVGFYGRGLDRFEPATGRFTHYRHSPTDSASLSDDGVSVVLRDHLGHLWVGTDGGLNRLDEKTGHFRRYLHNPADSTSLSDDHVRALYEDRQGTLWIGTGIPFENHPTPAGGLNRLERETNSFTCYLNQPNNTHSLVNNKVRAIFEDSRGTFWVGTAGDGLPTQAGRIR